MKALAKQDPKSIGPYKLVARLGAGGMGIVYLASRGADSVALKVLNSASIDNPLARARFKKEIETLRQINSPFVAKVIDSHADEETAWLAVEFVNGPDLRVLVQERGPLPLDEWITLANGLLSGLQAIHDEGVIHRDIKPANIIISESGPKIIDFGIAQEMDATSVTNTGSIAGSPAWLSPEQIDGATLTPASDLFSAGSVLHFAASGVTPWGDQNSFTTSIVFNNILTKEPNTSMIPQPQRDFIDALLIKEVKSRPNSKKALKLLESLMDSSPLQNIKSSSRNSLREPDSPRPRLPITRKSLGLVVGLGLGLAITLPLSIMAVQPSSEAGKPGSGDKENSSLQQTPTTQSQTNTQQSTATPSQTNTQQAPTTQSQTNTQQAPTTQSQTSTQQAPTTQSQTSTQQTPSTPSQTNTQQAPTPQSQTNTQQTPTPTPTPTVAKSYFSQRGPGPLMCRNFRQDSWYASAKVFYPGGEAPFPGGGPPSTLGGSPHFPIQKDKWQGLDIVAYQASYTMRTSDGGGILTTGGEKQVWNRINTSQRWTLVSSEPWVPELELTCSYTE